MAALVGKKLWSHFVSALPHNSRITKAATNRRRLRAGAPAPQTARCRQTDLRLGRIVRLLMDHATVVVSGTKIADEIGTSRSEVWRLVQQLRTLGVEIAGHPATGYQLNSVPDLLLPDMLHRSCKGTIFGEHIHHYYKIGSTNNGGHGGRKRGRARRQCFSGGAANRGPRTGHQPVAFARNRRVFIAR